MVVKTQVVLYIYDLLINGKEVEMEYILNKFNISIRTFRRYISEINSFLCNNFKLEVVSYDKSKNIYVLKQL